MTRCVFSRVSAIASGRTDKTTSFHLSYSSGDRSLIRSLYALTASWHRPTQVGEEQLSTASCQDETTSATSVSRTPTLRNQSSARSLSRVATVLGCIIHLALCGSRPGTRGTSVSGVSPKLARWPAACALILAACDGV